MEFHSYSKTCPFSSVEDIKGKHVTIMGLGLNGGGEAAVRFFLNKGAFVTVTDMKTLEQLKPTVERLNSDTQLDTSRLTYRLGEHRIEDFENADCVIKNPGVKFDGNKYLAAAKAIETDLSIFLRFTKCPIIAVTGSKGKSSTVSAIYYGLKEAGFDAFLGGNITVSPLTFFDQVTEKSPVVIEFSSWQLADLRGRGVLKPHIALITKIVPDHQNWYGNMEDYVKDKRLIYADQSAEDYAIFDAGEDEPGTGPECGGTWGNLFASEAKAKVLRYGDGSKTGVQTAEIPELGELLVPGQHMRTNANNAALVMKLMGVSDDKIIKILQRWPGISHRLQYFHSWNGNKFYNDSAATVPEAAAAATKAFNKPVILLTGGTDKGLSLEILSKTLAQKNTKDIYLLAGTATDKLLPDLNAANVNYNGPFASLDEMIKTLKDNLEKENQEAKVKKQNPAENIIVFSPGATSFGMFNNEFDRGEKYMNAITQYFQA